MRTFANLATDCVIMKDTEVLYLTMECPEKVVLQKNDLNILSNEFWYVSISTEPGSVTEYSHSRKEFNGLCQGLADCFTKQ